MSRALSGTWSSPHAGSTLFRLIVGGITPVWIALTQVISSTAPAAWIRWPSIDLTLVNGTFGARSPNTRRTAADSILSFSFVPVPCALTQCTSGRPFASVACGSMPA